ncbi:MAG: ABC transporter substrate-binding protein, partial [Leptospiraceae bacterium]|nr:ABC transporter substrate-binding protein [Leptospiraceae bacterium]
MPAIFTDRIARTYMRIMLRAAVIGLLVLQTACDDEPPISMDPVTDISYEVETGGSVDPIAADGALKGGTFTIWGGPNPKSLNVWVDNWHLSGEVMGLLYESLVTLHSVDNKPVGQLASRWEEAPDGVTFTFHIHPDANWSDGQPVTAEDVQFFYDTIMNKDHLTTVYRTVIGRFERPEVIDAKTVRITAKERYWKAFWDAGGFTAFPKHVWEGKDFNRINFDFPVVSGPYELLEYRRNRYVLLKRRADWWGRVLRYNQHKYNFDYIRYRFQEDRTAALETFKKGDYDMYAIYTASIWAQQTDAGALESVARNHVLRQEIFNQEPIGFQGLAINMRQERFQDVRVRQALFYLLDREKLNEQFMFDQYFLLNSYFPDLYPGNKNPAAEMYRYNPEKAGQLLDAAGWQVGDDGWRRKDGQVFSITFITYASDIRHMNKYVEWLKDAGIQA